MRCASGVSETTGEVVVSVVSSSAVVAMGGVYGLDGRRWAGVRQLTSRAAHGAFGLPSDGRQGMEVSMVKLVGRFAAGLALLTLGAGAGFGILNGGAAGALQPTITVNSTDDAGPASSSSSTCNS